MRKKNTKGNMKKQEKPKIDERERSKALEEIAHARGKKKERYDDISVS